MKYGWEIADEVQRFVGNSADIQFINKADYDALKAKYQKAVEALKLHCYCEKLHPDIGGKCSVHYTLAELGEKE